MSYTYIFRVVSAHSEKGIFSAGYVPYPAYAGIPNPYHDEPAFDPYQHTAGHYGFTKKQLRHFLTLVQKADEEARDDFFSNAALRVFRVPRQDIRVETKHQVVFHMGEPIRRLPLTNRK